MKKVLLLMTLGMVCAVCMAQNEEKTIPENVSTMNANVGSAGSMDGILSMMADPQNFLSADTTKLGYMTEVLLPIRGKSKFLHKNYMRQSLDVSPAISVGKTSTENELSVSSDETSSTGWGLNFGYSLLFVPGEQKGEMLQLNPLGFAYGIGFVSSFAQSDRYGTTCSFLGKLSIELGAFRSMGLGFDMLGGGGKSAGDVFMFAKGIVESAQADKIVPYTEWCWQYGGQLWMKVNLMGSLIKNAETLVFARLITSVDPGVMKEASQYHFNAWKGETWLFGTTIRYSF